MRKSSVVMMAIVLMALGAMLIAGNSVLTPLAQDAERGRELTRYLAGRGDIAPGSKAKLLRVLGSEKRLSAEGKGLLIELSPADALRARAGGLQEVVLRAARMGIEQTPGYRSDWVEVLLLPVAEGEGVRTLVRISPEGALEEPYPPLPRPDAKTATRR